MNENQVTMEYPVQVNSLWIKDRNPLFDIREGDFIWLTEDKGWETVLPFQVQSTEEMERLGLIETDQGWVRVNQVRAVRKDERWLRLLASQWLVTAVLNRKTQAEVSSQTVVSARELKILEGYQQSMIRWYLKNHREVETVWFEKQEKDILLGIQFCFLEKRES